MCVASGGEGGVNVGLQVVQGNFESEGHEKGTREHAHEDGQRVGLLPALHAAKQRWVRVLQRRDERWRRVLPCKRVEWHDGAGDVQGNVEHVRQHVQQGVFVGR